MVRILKDKRIKKFFQQTKKFQTSIILALVGLALVGAGLSFPKVFSSKEEPEFIPSQKTTATENKIFVDVAGAVAKPGVYELDSGSRINDLVNMAGGFAKAADKTWISKNVNLAAKLADGQKIYIPAKGEGSSSVVQTGQVAGEISGKININSATEAQLDSLPGIGPVRAGKIIENRPYSKIGELLTKKVLGEATFENIKDKIAVY
ncbi:MAG: ComEA family DNA-binding protein [Candidatus Woykebacteria bacterium]